ncbi:MAG: hypothetical protein PHS54_04125 [Clostridia bacterium]|nr:hypothetical protein [Clostridia bacterium]
MKIILNDEQSLVKQIELPEFVQALKLELQNQVEFSKSLEIKDFQDSRQIEIVQKTKTLYVTNRNTIKRAFKSKRDEWNKLSKDNIKLQDDILKVIEEEEERLEEMLEKAKLLKLRKENASKLEARKEELLKYEAVLSDEELLEMNEGAYLGILKQLKEEFILKKEKELEEEKQRIEREKELEEVRKKAKEEAEQEQIERERKRIETEKQQAEQKELEEERVKNNFKFQAFLKQNNFDSKTMEWKKIGDKIEIWTLPQKIAEITF